MTINEAAVYGKAIADALNDMAADYQEMADGLRRVAKAPATSAGAFSLLERKVPCEAGTPGHRPYRKMDHRHGRVSRRWLNDRRRCHAGIPRPDLGRDRPAFLLLVRNHERQAAA